MRLGFVITITMISIMQPRLVAAAEVYPTQELFSTSTTVVGEPIAYPATGPAKVTTQIVTIAPGAETVPHHHPAPMVAYILDGEVTVDYGPKGKRVFRRGDAFVEAMAVSHKGVNTGTVPVRILAISMGAEGTANAVADR
ncbi:cupin [Paramagnetospirillum marisnigri]|uniref:Cupin n=1 Tax=Paramagnetospirillum marisnigri TaxID=1285242 RepID=A0A178MQM5_9PROT|nr:cupin [Paramagnetospirillum marisnigri]